MSKMRTMLEASAAHHLEMAKCFTKLGGHLASVSPEASAECNNAAALHMQAGEDAIAYCKAVDAGDDGLGKAAPWPTGFSTIPTMDAKIRAVPRAGQPNTPDAIDVSAVPIAFRKLVEFDDEV